MESILLAERMMRFDDGQDEFQTDWVLNPSPETGKLTIMPLDYFVDAEGEHAGVRRQWPTHPSAILTLDRDELRKLRDVINNVVGE